MTQQQILEILKQAETAILEMADQERVYSAENLRNSGGKKREGLRAGTNAGALKSLGSQLDQLRGHISVVQMQSE